MYIISKFHDYYDTASCYGTDKECVYMRNTKLQEKELFTKWKKYSKSVFCTMPKNVEYNYKGANYLFVSGVIGFCGTIYPYIQVKITYNNKILTDTNCFYNVKEVSQFLDKICYKKNQGRYKYYRDWTNIKELEKFFNLNSWNEVDYLYRKYTCPIFRVYDIYSSNSKIELNPILKDYQFYKVKDSFTAYQDIYMYLSGVLGINDKIVTDIPDEYKLYEKGFDNRSFKRDKGTPERKRKKGQKNL